MERKIEDSWIKWHNLIIKWDELNTKTIHKIQNMLNKRTELEYFEENSNLGHLQGITDLREVATNKINSGASNLDVKSFSTNTKINFIQLLSEMDALTRQLTSCEEMLIHEMGKWDPFMPHPYFLDFTLSYFRNFSEELLYAYQIECQIKLKILHAVFTEMSSDIKTLYLTTLTVQPYIKEDFNLRIDQILTLLKIK